MQRSAPSVAVTRRIPSAGLEALEQAGLRVGLHDSDLAPDPARLRELLRVADAAITLLSDNIDADLLDGCPRLRVVANHAVGFENIDTEAAARRGVWVTNTPDVLTDATADLAMALILAVARRIVEADRYMRAGRYSGWGPKMLRGMDLRGATLGLVGFGRIGRAVAARAAAFGMKIIFADPSAGTEGGAEPGARKVELERLVMEADVVSLHCPYSPKLHHMFGARQFEAMKPSAIFINTARGKLHDERALAAALQSGAIAGAGLDVYEYEPRFDPALAERDNVVMLPHIGSATKGTRDQMALLAARNVIAVLDGERPLTPVNEPSLSGRGPGEAE